MFESLRATQEADQMFGLSPNDGNRSPRMKTFQNIKKEQLLESLRAHKEADRIVQGHYWMKDHGRNHGCAVGCSIHDFAPGCEGEHEQFEILFGIPMAIARLEDKIFENLSFPQAYEWPIRFAEAVPEGVDISSVVPSFLHRMVSHQKDRVEKIADEGELKDRAKKTIDRVLLVLEGWRDNGHVDVLAALEASDAARADCAYAEGVFDVSLVTRARIFVFYSVWCAARVADVCAGVANIVSVVNIISITMAVINSDSKADWQWMADVLIEELEACGMPQAIAES